MCICHHLGECEKIVGTNRKIMIPNVSLESKANLREIHFMSYLFFPFEAMADLHRDTILCTEYSWIPTDLKDPKRCTKNVKKTILFRPRKFVY